MLDFANKYNIPFAETQAGKSAIKASEELNLGGVGVTGNLAANIIAKDCDLVIGVGTRFTDFTTGSKSLFKNENIDFLTINTSRFDASKLDAVSLVGDAKVTLEYLNEKLEYYTTQYSDEVKHAKKAWADELDSILIFH